MCNKDMIVIGKAARDGNKRVQSSKFKIQNLKFKTEFKV